MFATPYNSQFRVYPQQLYPRSSLDRHISYLDEDDFLLNTPAVVDPAEQARERFIHAIKEQKAARKAYAELIAERELARLEGSEAALLPAAFDNPVDNFDLDYSDILRSKQQRALIRQQHQRELARRAEQEELVRAHRQKVAQEAALRRQQELELAVEVERLQQLELLRQQKLEALRKEKLEALRQQKLETLRQKKLEAIRQQQLAEARRQQEEFRQKQQQLEAQRKAAVAKKQREAEAVARAVALAVAFAQQFSSEEPKQESAVQKKDQTATEPKPSVRHIRFVPHASVATAQKPAPASTAPTASTSKAAATSSAPVASSSANPVRVDIRDSKGKASAHVRVNSVTPPAAATPTPADAIAALMLLSSDLDGYLSPAHEWHSEAHRRHSLNQLLEQVDSVESGGDEAVRDVRRTLVRRVERALEGLPDEEPVKAKGMEIREPEVAAVPAPAVSTAEPEGYEIPDFLEPTPAVDSVPVEDETAPSVALNVDDAPASSSAEVAIEAPVHTPAELPSEWTTSDPGASRPLAVEPIDADLSSESAFVDPPLIDLVEPAAASLESSQATVTPSTASEVEEEVVSIPPAIVDTPSTVAVEASAPATPAPKSPVLKSSDRDGLSDWESTKSDIEDGYVI